MSFPEHPTVEQLLLINAELREMVGALQQRVAELESEVERLRKQGPRPPALSDLPHFVKPNRPKREHKDKQDKKGRRQRDRGYSRPLDPNPTRTETHAVEQCPDCGRNLAGGTLHSQREVIDIPPVRVEVVRHQFLARWCGVCKKRHIPRSGEALSSAGAAAVGQRRFGVRLMSLVAHLVNVCRTPVRTVKKLLASLFGVDISCGGIIALLKSIAQAGERMYDNLREQVRSSSFVHADETGWREDGVNGYLWSFSTPDVRYFVRDQSRGHQVSEEALGSGYRGIIVSDFYGGYNYHLGLHQRCWAHLLRDVKKLCETFPLDEALIAWSKQLQALYVEAASCCWVRKKDRIRARERFQRRLVALAHPYLNTGSPQAVLAKRLIQFEPELFTFVEHPEVPPDNNAAERAIRPAVIARKVSGGTRSKDGSDTRAVLMSLFGTWQAQNVDPLEACVRLLTSPS